MTFTRHQAGETISENDINELQAAIEALQAAGPGGGGAAVPGARSNQGMFARQGIWVSTHCLWDSSTTFVQELARHKRDGFAGVRLDLNVASLCPTARGSYDATYETRIYTLVTEAARAGLGVIFSGFEIPNWMHTPYTNHYVPPTDPQDYADVIAHLADSLKFYDNVAWEVWNEPSLFGTVSASGTYWWRPVTVSDGNTYDQNETIAANDYTDMLIATYDAVKAVAPEHLVMGVSAHQNQTTFLQKVIDRMRATGTGRICMDAVSGHPYTGGKAPADTTGGRLRTFIGMCEDFRTTLDTAKLVGMPVILSEWGYSLTINDAVANDTIRGDYFEAAADLIRQYPWCRALAIFGVSHRETTDFILLASGSVTAANLASLDRIAAKARALQGGRVAATAAVAGAGYSVGNAAWWPVVFKGTDVEDTGGQMHYTSDSNITGTVQRTQNSATLSGSGTAFTTELSVGQVILIGVAGATTHVVTAIASNTSCTISPTYAGTSDGAGVVAQRRADYVVAPYPGAYTCNGWFAVPQNATGIRIGRLDVNGTTVMTQGPLAGNASNPTGFAFSAKLNLKQWDRVSLGVYQDSGGALVIPAATAGLSLVRDSPLPF